LLSQLRKTADHYILFLLCSGYFRDMERVVTSPARVPKQLKSMTEGLQTTWRRNLVLTSASGYNMNILLASSINDPSRFNAPHLKMVISTRIREVCGSYPDQSSVRGVSSVPSGDCHPNGCLTPRQTGRLTVGRNITLTLTMSRRSDFHRSPASRRRRPKGNPVPGDITGPPCSWAI
jgi:hypothetical protein